MFAFLEANGIGQKSALFYVARAARAETARDFSSADAAFAAGVAAGATPADRLTARQAEFHARMAARVARQLAAGGRDGATAAPPRRTALAAVRPVAAGARGRTASGRTIASITAPPPARSAGAASLAVFVDEDLSRAPTTTATAAARPGEGWTSLAPRSASVKENEPAVSQWVGTMLPPSSRGQRGGAPAPAPFAPLSIPADEGLEPAPAAAAPTRARGGATALRKRLDGGGGADLVADPLAGHRADAAAAAAVAAAATTDAGATPVDDLADVTLATRDALHAVGGFFAGALPGAAPWGDGPGSPADDDAGAADAGADATLSTRDALDALAAAFGGGGDDTLPLGRARPGNAAPGSPGSLDVREDTLFRMGGNGGITGFEVREDTLFRLGAAATAAATTTTTPTTADENAPPPAADPENAGPRLRRSAKRGLGGGGGVLAEVAEGVEPDAEAEAALRTPPEDAGSDEFEVYCDGGA